MPWGARSDGARYGGVSRHRAELGAPARLRPARPAQGAWKPRLVSGRSPSDPDRLWVGDFTYLRSRSRTVSRGEKTHPAVENPALGKPGCAIRLP